MFGPVACGDPPLAATDRKMEEETRRTMLPTQAEERRAAGFMVRRSLPKGGVSVKGECFRRPDDSLGQPHSRPFGLDASSALRP